MSTATKPREFVLITASTSDIGLSVAARLIHHNLILHGRDETKLLAIKGKLNSINEVLLWIADLKDVSDVQSNLKNLMIENQATVIGFVHAAASLKILPVKNFRLDYAKEIFDVNYFSAVEIIRGLLGKHNSKQLKSIVIVSALSSKFGDKGNSAYVASKGALNALVKTLAIELSPDVRINAVLPGGVKTRMTAHLIDSGKSHLVTDNPLGEGSSEDVASAVYFLLSSESKWITGQELIVDGGRSCNIFKQI